MRDYEFEITIVAVVRVQAENEDRAREVIASSALGSPGSCKREDPHTPTWPYARPRPSASWRKKGSPSASETGAMTPMSR
jgi:hypothetical protein